MSGNPAPEKVAALAAALSEEFYPDELAFVDDTEAFWRPFAAKVLPALNAAGYDVTRIEEGERPERDRDALIALADKVLSTGALRHRLPHPDDRTRCAACRLKAVADDALRAALAASDEAAKPSWGPCVECGATTPFGPTGHLPTCSIAYPFGPPR